MTPALIVVLVIAFALIAGGCFRYGRTVGAELERLVTRRRLRAMADYLAGPTPATREMRGDYRRGYVDCQHDIAEVLLDGTWKLRP